MKYALTDSFSVTRARVLVSLSSFYSLVASGRGTDSRDDGEDPDDDDDDDNDDDDDDVRAREDRTRSTCVRVVEETGGRREKEDRRRRWCDVAEERT